MIFQDKKAAQKLLKIYSNFQNNYPLSTGLMSQMSELLSVAKKLFQIWLVSYIIIYWFFNFN